MSLFENLKNKKVLITGASGEIGAVIAELFGSYGAEVGLHYFRNRSKASSLQKELSARQAHVAVFQADLQNSSQIKALVKKFIGVFGSIDILVNNAGTIIGNEHFLDLKEKSWDSTLNLNLKAPFLLSQHIFPYMKKQRYGKIINISSISSKYGGSESTMHYAASKAALEAVTVGMARFGAPFNIQVNCVRCGFINTSFHRKIGRTEEDIKKRIKMIPLGRAGEPLDIARTVLFLASESGDFVTGQTFTVSGGD